MTRVADASEEEHVLDNLELKRQRFEDAGRFPVRKLVVIGIIVAVLGFAGFVGYQRWQVSRQVGGVLVMADVRYPAYQVDMVTLDTATQTDEGMSIPLADLKRDYIVGAVYNRTNPMPEGYQMAAGGNILPVLAYIAPSGKLVVATSFCEPCRSTTFHFEGNILVCDVCYTRWELNTLLGIGGGCFDYPPEELTAETRGDMVFVPAADLEGWVPRAYQDENVVDENMSTSR
ncbi:MAG: Fe-S-containing protein [Thermoleophilia bacterium]